MHISYAYRWKCTEAESIHGHVHLRARPDAKVLELWISCAPNFRSIVSEKKRANAFVPTCINKNQQTYMNIDMYVYIYIYASCIEFIN